ncbi:hypothetical protein OG589_14675 [Sphaerisporangium sp. NBC_01403]|uniref:hypothetical protein n=1 Tax=Sphaerisporangium sp. NBC_01403 TaxID=2903599 RepID=UPI00324F8E96
MPAAPARPVCEWCKTAPATELLVRDRPTACGGMDRACSLACGGCGDRLAQVMARVEDVVAVYRLAVSPLIPASEEAA